VSLNAPSTPLGGLPALLVAALLLSPRPPRRGRNP